MPSASAQTTALDLPLATKRIIFATLMCCVFLAMLDTQIVATAMPTIIADLGDMEKFGWIGSAYLITHSAVMPICGKLGDLFGRKYVLLASVFVFLVGSLCCGLAPSVNGLIAARLVQGLGAGGIIVSVFAVNADLFTPRERAQYQSFASLVLLLAATLGPVMGGFMTQYWGWRSIFLINLPIGLVAMALLIAILPYRKPSRRPQIDYLGAALMTLLVTLVVVWADSPQLFGGLFTLPALLVLVALAVSVGLFIAVERRAPEPVLSPSLLTQGTVARLLLISVGSGSIALGMVNYHALYLQNTTGLDPAKAGSFFIALMTGVACGSMLTGRFVSRTGRYKVIMCAGLAGTACTMAVLALLPAGQSFTLLAAIFAILGFCNGLGQQIPTLAVQYYAPPKDLGSATGAVSLFRLTGAAVATSVYGSILHYRLPHDLAHQAPDMVVVAYHQAFIGVYGLAAMVVAGCFALAFSLPAGRIMDVPKPAKG